MAVAAYGFLMTRSLRIAAEPTALKVPKLAVLGNHDFESKDARLLPHAHMSEEDASIWTAVIDEAASRPVGTEALGEGADLFHSAAPRGTVSWPLIGGLIAAALLVGALAAVGRKTFARP